MWRQHLILTAMASSCLLAWIAMASDGAPPAARTADATRPSETLSGVTARRVEQLKANLKAFVLQLSYSGQQDKPFYNLTLHVGPMEIRQNNPFNQYVQISPDEASQIIDYLAADGYFDRAAPPLKVVRQLPAANYTLKVWAPSPEAATSGRASAVLDPRDTEDLGFNLETLKKIDGLRTALHGEAATATDTLLTRLSGLRKQWEAEKLRHDGPAPVAPATQPALER